jgi:large subunit ribosomal protein L29
MALIVTLREKSANELREMLETLREEMFNLRFQQAAGSIKDFTQVRKVRREIAQIQTVLNDRERAADVAAEEPAIAAALEGRSWSADARFDYVESAWLVSFVGENDAELASAKVNLNRKQSAARRDRRDAERRVPRLVLSYEIAE